MFSVPEGFGIVLAAARRPAVERAYTQLRGTILRAVKDERVKSIYDAYAADLLRGADVSVDTRAVEAVEVKAPPVGTFPGEAVCGVVGGIDDPTADCPCAGR